MNDHLHRHGRPQQHRDRCLIDHRKDHDDNAQPNEEPFQRSTEGAVATDDESEGDEHAANRTGARSGRRPDDETEREEEDPRPNGRCSDDPCGRCVRYANPSKSEVSVGGVPPAGTGSADRTRR
jgi:hypothetical protein